MYCKVNRSLIRTNTNTSLLERKYNLIARRGSPPTDGLPATLSLAHRCTVRGFHQLDGMFTVQPVNITFTRVCDDPAVCRNQAPTPLVADIAIHFIKHDRDSPMDNMNLRTFLVSYNHDGARWSLEIKARDFSDAKARLNALTFASIDGELIRRVPASLGPIAIISTAVRNAFARFKGSFA